MPIQTMRAMLALLFIILFAQFSVGNSTVRHDSNLPNRPGTFEKRASSVTLTLSVLGLLATAFVSVSPALRVCKELNGQENVTKDRWFMAFLALVTLNYAAWLGYSVRGCPKCEAAIFMIISSIFGLVVSCLWAGIGLVRDLGSVADQEHKLVLAMCFTVAGMVFGIGSYDSNESGYYALAGAVVAHLCRAMSTDYKQLSVPQMIVSFIGGLSGLLCFWHPDWAAAQPFWCSSAVIAGIRALEFAWWFVLFLRSPTPGDWLQQAKVWIADARARLASL